MLSAERLLEYGPLGLFLVAFFESTVFPIPPDVLLLPLCLMNPRLSWWYAFLATAASILGAFLGYAVGRKAGRPVVERFVAAELVEEVQVLFNRYGGWAVGIAAFTPVPYKVFTFGAGVFRVPFFAFTLASAIGRASRFFLEGAMVYFLGERARTYLGRNFELASFVLTAILLLAVAAYPKIAVFLRRRRVHQNPVLRNLVRVFSDTGRRFRSARSLGLRFLAGLTASAVFFLLVVVFLWDLSGPERAVLNRSLSPIYERLSHLLLMSRASGFWSLWGAPWIWGSLVALGVLRWVSWDHGRYLRKRPPEFGRFSGIGAKPVSSAFRSFVRIGLLAAGVYASEVVFGGYVHRIYGTSLSLSPGHVFLTPYFLVFGVYLLSKGAPKPVQIPLLGLMAVLAVGNSARLVMSFALDAATATASLLVSLLMLAVSYTLLLSGKNA